MRTFGWLEMVVWRVEKVFEGVVLWIVGRREVLEAC